ncbi:PAF-acetylhydrolase family member [Dothidotthia symphoricarpi CBS 119687]|uniref:Putative phospholipase n=1 Tax=Dothidotthia symphoricarpi CBS 119687 TaxID=1392245 RepID=A0A6A6A9M7_9PLEO|nr:PAF-acetylhydrolase family member [Dothidotthia symphoricarpi CBS 119687]KAF2128509.1 PAF-acetylhydrolase family member [Dothidotthia symphoricarpi CBS 119687]
MAFSLPSFTWRRVLVFGSTTLVFFFFVFTLTPITSPLPPYTGPHEVGILDIETEVQRKVIHGAILKESGEKAFELETLAITLYYPSSLPAASPNARPWARPWLPQPVSLIGAGYARIASVPALHRVFTFALWALGSSTVIPGVVDAPILSGAEKVLVEESAGAGGLGKIMSAAAQDHQELKRDEDFGLLPCVVFTHGMAGMSQSYSHYLGSIASHGYVVAAVEHRDGSGPGSIIHYPDGKEKKVWHMTLKALESNPPMTDADLKAVQLEFREQEIVETIKLFQQLNAGDAPLVNLKPDSPRESLPGFKHRLNMSAVTVAGHSYGATGVLQALKSAGTKAMPINGGIALDPGKGSGPLNENIDVPLLVFHSGQWTEKQVQFYGQGWHFDVVRKIVENVKEGWFMTLTGSAHPSCTDAPLIVPWIMKLVTGTTLDSKTALREYIDASVRFLEYLKTGEKKGVLESEVTSVAGPLGDADKRGKVKGPYGADWEVHVVPKMA